MGSIIGHRINYNGVCVLRGQWYIATKKLPKYPQGLGHTKKRAMFAFFVVKRKHDDLTFDMTFYYDNNQLKIFPLN